MARLTNEIRDQIASECIDTQFKQEEKALQDEEHNLGMELYHAAFDKELTESKTKVLEEIKKLPEHWFCKRNTATFNCSGYRLTLVLKESVKIPYSKIYDPLESFSGELSEKAQAFVNKKEDFKKKRKEAERALKSILYSFTTTNALQKGWPEGLPFYKDYLNADTSSQVPTVMIAEVNKLLGLPVEGVV